MYQRRNRPSRFSQLGFIWSGAKRALLRRRGFDMRRALWPTGTEPGLWYDQPDLTSAYQESTGVTALTAPGSGVIDPPVGFRADKRLGMVRGPEQVSSGDFSSAAPWTLNASANISGGKLNVTAAIASPNPIATNATAVIAGKYYEVIFTIDVAGGLVSAGLSGTNPGTGVSAVGTHREIIYATVAGNFVITSRGGGATAGLVIDNFSAKELAGNHSTQATAAARPAETARVNLLDKTEALTTAPWTVNNVSVAASGSAWRITDATAAASGSLQQSITAVATGLVVTYLVEFERQASGSFAVGFGSFWCFVDHATLATVNDVVFSGTSPTSSVALVSGTRYRLTCTVTTSAATSVFSIYPSVAAGAQVDINSVANQAVTGFLDVYNAHLQLGGTARYQHITTANTYDASVAPLAEKFDGVDDGYSTAPFAAGTLTNNMDCFIAVKRLSGATGILGANASGVAPYFAYFDPAGGLATASNGVGASSTYWVNGAALAAAATAVQLNTALTVGAWHILEVRNLDLSTWTKFLTSQYAAFFLNGLINQVVLCPAKSDGERLRIRRAMGAKVGLLL